MRPQDMIPPLTKLGFTDLTLVKTEGKTSTFSFDEWSLKLLKATLGDPTVTSDKKVAVFNVPNLGRLGVAPSVNRVRVIAEVEADAPAASTSHLAGTEVPKPYLTALEKAKVNPKLRLAWMAKMWDWFNENKFGGRMTAPKFVTEQVRGRYATARGVYFGGAGHRPGKLYLAPFLFNARPPFILEVYLHEMCHQASWTLDKVFDASGTQGHGPAWQAWMRKVGLDPRRFDPTEEVEYMSLKDAVLTDLATQKHYGKRVPETFWDDKVKVNTAFVGDCWLRYKERALKAYARHDGSSFEFTFRNPKGELLMLRYPSWPAGSVYKDKA